jgi:hypothetical protein
VIVSENWLRNATTRRVSMSEMNDGQHIAPADSGHRSLRDQLAAHARRLWTHCGVLLLYLVVAVAVMSPLAPEAPPESGADDLGNHVSGIIEARHALEEGQFPIRVAPHQNLQTRYPIFQFYGNLPFTVGGLLYRATDFNPYLIWKLVVTASVVVGGFFTYCCGRRLTRQTLPAVVAGAMFITAPYLLTDIHGRFAYPETISFALIPAVFFYAMRCFVSRTAWPVLAGGVCWSCLALSHGVTFLYASLFFGLFFLSFTSVRRKSIARVLRVGLAYALGLCLTAWYIAPQRLLVPHLAGGLLFPVFDCAWLTLLGVLLAPTVVCPVHLPTPYIDIPQHFGLQVGWPILAAVGLALASLWSPFAALHGRRAFLTRLLGLFFFSFFLVWTPFDFWSFAPVIFNYVQFSYRLLMFVVLWGCLLASYAVALGLQGKMRPVHLALCLLGLGVCTASHLAPHQTSTRVTIAKEIANPNMGRGGANYIYNLSGNSLLQTSHVHDAMDWGEHPFGVVDVIQHHNTGVVEGEFPAFYPGDLLAVEGVVPAGDSTVLTIRADGQVLAVQQLPPGSFRLAIPVVSPEGKERIRIRLQAPLRCEPPPAGPITRPVRRPAFFVNKLALQRMTFPPANKSLLKASQTREMTVVGHPTSVTVRLAHHSLVQLPVLYYPNQIQVVVNGQRAPTGNLGRFVALELPPGDHVITVDFTGLRWANVLSLTAWFAVGIACACLLGLRLWRNRQSLGFGTFSARRRPRPAPVAAPEVSRFANEQQAA